MSVNNYLPQFKVYLNSPRDRYKTPQLAEPSPSAHPTNSPTSRANKLVNIPSFNTTPVANIPRKTHPNSKRKGPTRQRVQPGVTPHDRQASTNQTPAKQQDPANFQAAASLQLPFTHTHPPFHSTPSYPTQSYLLREYRHTSSISRLCICGIPFWDRTATSTVYSRRDHIRPNKRRKLLWFWIFARSLKCILQLTHILNLWIRSVPRHLVVLRSPMAKLSNMAIMHTSGQSASTYLFPRGICCLESERG